MREPLAMIVSQLDEIGLTYEISKDRYVSSRIPTRLRGDLPVLIEVGERTAVVRAFIMRAPDRDADEVYRRALRRNLDGSAWSFAVDDDGDVFLVARLTVASRPGPQADEMLGQLSVLVDETYEGLMRAGFDVPRDTHVGPPPGARV